MTAFISVRVRDHSDEYSTVRIPIAEMLAVSVWGDLFLAVQGIISDLEAVTLGTVVSWQFTQVGETFEDVRPESNFADRERGARIFYHGSHSGKKGNLTIPAPDNANMEATPGTDLYVLTDEPLAAFLAELEAHGEIAIANPPPLTGYWNDEIVVDKVVKVGRKN